MPEADTSAELPSIPVSYSRLLARELGLQEKELGSLLWNTGLDGYSLTRDDTLLTATQLLQIIRNALRLSGDPALGLRVGRLLTPATHGSLGFLAHASPDLQTAVEAFREFLPSRIYYARMEIREEGEWLACYLRPDFDAEEVLYRFVIEAFSMALLSLVEFVLGQPLEEGQLHFGYPAPAHLESYQNYFTLPSRFDAGESKVLIPQRLCRIPNASSDHVMYNIALQQCQAMLRQLPEKRASTKQRVQAIMLSYPPGQLSEEDLAERLFITKRTLARRLEKEGTGFRPLRDELLSTMAARYLSETRMSVEAIAGLLNYHDAANFRRAFKRWFGTTPARYRGGDRSRYD